MTSRLLLAAFLLSVLPWPATLAAGRPEEIPFEKVSIDLGANEACAFADINGDGKPDIVSGENWYQAPAWKKHKYRELEYVNGYLDDFSDLPMDVNADGHVDVVSASWFGRKLVWLQNPGRGQGAWKEHVIDSGFNTEFAFLVDLDNDGKARELLPQFGGRKAVTAWYEFRNGKWQRYDVHAEGMGHGIGAGDVNKDGRTDILTPKGWFEAPADPRAGQWTHHPDFDFKEHIGFMHVIDINGDGRNDILLPHAHDYGLFWLEQGAGGKWTRHVIDDTWSQVHATTLVDLNGDGQLDLIAGKRYMAHDHDPGARDPLGIYWYEFLKPAPGGKVPWVRHIIDYSTRAGGGMQIPVMDIDGDGDLDFAAAGKSGLFLFVNKRR